MKQLSLLLVPALLVACCQTTPPDTQVTTPGTTAPAPAPTNPAPTNPTPTPTPAPAAPYNAAGNWGVKVTGLVPGKPDDVFDFAQVSALAVRMTNAASGDFTGQISYQGQTADIVRGNTARGVVYISPGTRSDGSWVWALCEGAFDAQNNTYVGECRPDPATSTPEEIANFEALKATGAKMTLSMTRL
ncbi:hypothetical protein ACFP81_01940 [Deinococcus lacus]|uniref:Lipoprotein n=1 Tax=Deinococcus lacus TaxID=392561 RepID=A0ABW1YCH0_9DEIO